MTMTLGMVREVLDGMAKAQGELVSLDIDSSGFCIVFGDSSNPLAQFQSIAELDSFLTKKLTELNRADANKAPLIAFCEQADAQFAEAQRSYCADPS